MKIHLTRVDDTELLPLFQARASLSKLHQTETDPAASDLILILGSFGLNPHQLLGHALYKAFPERCAVYTEDDNYLPLAPGVYCSAHRDLDARSGRIFSYSYVSRNGRYQNPYLAETSSASALNAPVDKRYLFTFQGGSTSLLRKRLFNLKFNRSDIQIENTSSYYHWDDSQADRRDRQRAYAETVAASHFVLCPRGAGAGSIRLFEVMAAGVAPVLLSDEYELPPGPEWESFLLRVPELDISRLPELLGAHRGSAIARGELARRAFIDFFSMEQEFDGIVELAARSLRHGPPAEKWFRRRQTGIIRRARFGRAARTALRSAALRILKLLRLRNPYQMNR